MIQRYVFVKLKPEFANDAGRREAAQRTAVLSEVPGVRELRVGLPADETSAAAWDLSIALCFDDIEAVTAYIEHPTHRGYADEFLLPRMQVLKKWNFEV